MKPSQDLAPGARGGGAPASPIVGGPRAGDTLPIKEGWGTSVVRWLKENVEFGIDEKAQEVLLIILTLILSYVIAEPLTGTVM